MKPFVVDLPIGRALKVGRSHVKLLGACPKTFVATLRATPGRGLVAIPEGHWGEVAHGVSVRFKGMREGKGRCVRLEVMAEGRKIRRVPRAPADKTT